MRMLSRLLSIVVLLLLAAGCASKSGPVEGPSPSARLAVSAFSNPQYNWEMISGCLPEQCSLVKPEQLARLDEAIGVELRKSERRYISAAGTRQCQEIVQHEQRNDLGKLNALSYWLDVGRCIPADYLLVPQIMHFQDRIGGEWGVEKPASVIIHFYLLDITERRIAKRVVFDETQQSLSENLLNTGTFFKRGGKWLTADALAHEAIQEAIKELGL